MEGHHQLTGPIAVVDDVAARLADMPSLLPRLFLLAGIVSVGSAVIGYLVFGEGEQHQLFRDVGPVSLYSVAQTLLVAALGLLIALRESRHRDFRDLNNFWFLAGLGFLFLSIDGPLDLHGKVGGWVTDATGAEHPLGFHRVSDFIIALYMVAGLVVAAAHYREITAYPRVLQCFFTAAVFVATMVVIDGFAEQTPTVWVIEETIKLFAGVFFIAAFMERYRISLRGETHCGEMMAAATPAYPA